MLKAAKLWPLQSHQTFGQLSHRCVSTLASDLGSRYSREATLLAAFDVYDQKQESAVNRMKAFFADLENVIRDGKGLVLYGAVGTGKDHLLAAALYFTASAGLDVRWVSGQEIYGRIRDSMDSGQREDSLMREWERPMVLGISDPIPPIGKPSEWNTMQLYRLLDRRYRALRPTWVSLNADSAADADAKLSAPVFDRLREGAELIPCFWQSYRGRKK